MTGREYFFIPVELIVAIFLLLPPRALMKLICVCKEWKNLITNQRFIDEYSKRLASKGTDSILYMPTRNAENMSFNLLANGSFVGPLAFEQIPFPFHPMNYLLVGCSNGLVCFSRAREFGKTIYLFNPCIRKYRIIRSSSIDTSIARSTVLGFGYHSETNDCKIIRIYDRVIVDCCVHTSLKRTTNGAEPQVEVYSLSTNSWKRIYADSFPWEIIYSYSGIQVNESLHWYSDCNASESQKVILSFDLGKDTFGKIGLPDFSEDNDTPSEFLGVHKETLSIFKYCPFPNIPEADFCYLWVMKEYGVESSWTKLYTVQVPRFVCRPLNFTRSGEILLGEHDSMVSVYDFDKQEMKFTGIRDESSSLAFANYNESLLLVEVHNERVNQER